MILGGAAAKQHQSANVSTPKTSQSSYFSHPHNIVNISHSKGTTSTSNFTVTSAGNKDNVYIVTLPQHQVILLHH
jgi:hypothetical protein